MEGNKWHPSENHKKDMLVWATDNNGQIEKLNQHDTRAEAPITETIGIGEWHLGETSEKRERGEAIEND